MSQVQVPARPDVPATAPRKRMSGWAITGLIVLGLFVFGAISNAVDGTETTPTPTTSVTDEGGLTPAMLVDSLEPGLLSEFCSAYAGIDESTAHALWIQEYNEELAGMPGIPSADDLYYEMTSRC